MCLFSEPNVSVKVVSEALVASLPQGERVVQKGKLLTR
jgi:hypothetical protein